MSDAGSAEIKPYDWENKHKLAYDLISGRCYFTGSWCRDYWYHILNWHPLLSLFLCDRCNPYTKKERCAVFIVVTSFTMLPCVGLTMTLEAVSNNILATLRSGKASDKYLEFSALLSQKLAVFLIITIPVMILQYLIEYAIYFREIFRYNVHLYQSRDECCAGCKKYFCTVLKWCMVCFKKCCLWSALWMSLFIWIVGYNLEKTNHGLWLAMTPLAVSRVQFWFIWFVIDLWFPFIGFVPWWRKEKAEAEKPEPEPPVYTICPDGDGPSVGESPPQAVGSKSRLQYITDKLSLICCCTRNSQAAPAVSEGGATC